MKTKLFNIALFALLSVSQIFAQDVTTVRANNSDISDNLDLQAVASIFGDSRDLEDFERRLNDPSTQISNLDLNGDNRVDYLRVIEVTEGHTHLIILQSVLAHDTFQDVATIEVERDRSNNVRVQVVGDVYMYGPNYIYEPVYVARPVIFDVFWVSSYRPYYSPWYWGYYPTYYNYWAPYPIYRYRNNIHVHINHYHTYNYVTTRYSSRAVALHNSRRANGYERQHPDRSFTRRTNMSNRYALEQTRSTSRDRANVSSSRSSLNRNEGRLSTNNAGRLSTNNARSNGTATVRNSNASRSNGTAAARNSSTTRNSDAPALNGNTTVRSNSASRPGSATTRSESPALNSSRSNTSIIRNNPAERRPEVQSTRQSTTINRSQGVQRSTAPSVRSNPAPAARQSTPARTAPSVRSNPAPQMRSTPAPTMRQSSPSMRQSSPARQAGNNSRSSRG